MRRSTVSRTIAPGQCDGNLNFLNRWYRPSIETFASAYLMQQQGSGIIGIRWRADPVDGPEPTGWTRSRPQQLLSPEFWKDLARQKIDPQGNADYIR